MARLSRTGACCGPSGGSWQAEVMGRFARTDGRQEGAGTSTTSRRDEHPARHPGDVVRLAVGALVLGSAALAARAGRLSRFEVDVFRLVNDLPRAATGVLVVVMQAGTLAAVPISGVAAFLGRRRCLARDLAVSGLGAWLGAKVVKSVVGRGRPAALLVDVVFHGGRDTGLGFPSGHAAVAAALATAAGPYLPRPARRVAWVGVGLVALGRLHVGAHLPLDVVGGATLGWVVGSAVHLLVGSPARRPAAGAVRAALAACGLGPVDVGCLVVDARGSTPFVADTAAGRLFVKVVGREQRDADALFKAWRMLAYRQIEDEAPFATPKQQVEHEAYLSLLAARAGVRTPEPVATAAVAGGLVLLAQPMVDGTTLERADPAALTDEVQRDLWAEVGRLHSARIAHRDLRLANVLLDGAGRPWLLDFGFAETGASDRRLAQDVAELLTSLAGVVGPETALRNGLQVLGPAPLAAALPLLQPLALSAATRAGLRAHRGLLPRLRAAVADATGAPPGEPEPLTRVRPSTVVLVIGAGFAVHLLLPQIGAVHQTLDAVRSARIGWLSAALVASALTYLAAATAQMGAVAQPLPYLRTAAVQVASSFANRLTPSSLGGLGVNLRYLEHNGLERAEATAAVALNTAAGLVVHLAGLFLAATVVGASGNLSTRVPSSRTVLIGVVAALAATGIAIGTPWARRRLAGPARQAARGLADVMRRPLRATQLFGGSAAVTGAYILALAASMRAVAVHLPFEQVAAAYLVGAAVASASPTPGGLGAMEAALVASLTTLGAPTGPTVAGVLAFRLLTFWLPVLPGWVAYRRLRRLGAL